jgi:hypothetical protein
MENEKLWYLSNYPFIGRIKVHGRILRYNDFGTINQSCILR